MHVLLTQFSEDRLAVEHSFPQTGSEPVKGVSIHSVASWFAFSFLRSGLNFKQNIVIIYLYYQQLFHYAIKHTGNLINKDKL